MGRSDPGPQKYKESNKIDCKYHQRVHSHHNQYWTEIAFRNKNDIVTRFSTTPSDRFVSRYRQDNCHKFTRSKSEHDCSIAHNEYLRHNLYIKSAVEKQNALSFQLKKVSFRNYTPKILSQEVNMGMWI